MKATKITYWIATGLIALMMAFSAYSYLTQASMQQGFQHLGLPDWFRISLAFAKFVGVILLLAPVSSRAKEWAYAGFAFTFIAALIGHTAVGDPLTAKIGPVVALVLLTVSYVTYYRLQANGNRGQLRAETSRV